MSSKPKQPRDVVIHKSVTALLAIAKDVPEHSEAITSLCNSIFNSDSAAVEDVYSYCVELIEPHVIDHGGMNTVTQDSLCSSVCESLEYLIKFWLANKDKPEIDLVLD